MIPERRSGAYSQHFILKCKVCNYVTTVFQSSKTFYMLRIDYLRAKSLTHLLHVANLSVIILSCINNRINFIYFLLYVFICLFPAAHLAIVGRGEDRRGCIYRILEESSISQTYQDSIFFSKCKYNLLKGFTVINIDFEIILKLLRIKRERNYEFLIITKEIK